MKTRIVTLNETQIASEKNLSSGHRSLRRFYSAKRGLRKIEAILRDKIRAKG